MKVNSTTDINVIRKLSEPSCAGVIVDLLVRGICCILPGVLGKTDGNSLSHTFYVDQGRTEPRA